MAPCLILNVSTPSSSSRLFVWLLMTLPCAPPSTRPQRHRLDVFNFNKLKNNNFGYRRESRTSLNWLRPSP
ncbi:hypothetical protein DSO57_1023712 [Entomophthora muscae]|uniref:Uncharacterized protein n=1 Tax=Entomophthora muscae TaxID=34485 RepID=A0ACC2UBU3_9FUNG|nr:hypothetical protein DSO57_1023712 [Entomophthora muscae]